MSDKATYVLIGGPHAGRVIETSPRAMRYLVPCLGPKGSVAAIYELDGVTGEFIGYGDCFGNILAVTNEKET